MAVNALQTIGRTESSISNIISIFFGSCMIIGGIILIILSFIYPNSKSNTDPTCTTCPKPKLNKFNSLYLGIAIGLILFGILLIIISKLINSLVQNHPTLAGIAGGESIIGGIAEELKK